MTLVEETDAVCVGTAYRVEESVLEHLDHRERNGYERVPVTMCLSPTNGAPPARDSVNAVTYIASPENPAFLGPADIDDVVAQIARSHGPSGSNRD